jgi:hypothetical protein
MHTKITYDAKIEEFIETSLLSIEKLHGKCLHKSRLNFLQLVIPAIICAR